MNILDREMASMGEENKMLRGQIEIWGLMFDFANSMALKTAIELGIADIINSHGGLVSLSQIASGVESPCPEINYLARIMRFLVRKQVFTAQIDAKNGETLYGLNYTSRWLLKSSHLTLNHMILMENHQWLHKPWHYLGECVKDGGNTSTCAFKKAHGRDIWEFSSKNPEFNGVFNDGMACTAKVLMGAFISAYKDGFDNVKTLVDVGGGTGQHVAEIVKAHPHIKGINFDLPHVVTTAPNYDGITHVGGDMFESVPPADAIFMKWILHDWEDKYCIKVLENCHKAIPRKTGKLIVFEMVVEPEGNHQFGDMDLIFDLLMIAHANGGKERTEIEWKNLLEAGGFRRHKIIKIPALLSIIEAYPE